MWTSGSGGSCKSGSGVSEPSASRWWITARRLCIDGVNEKAMSSMPSGWKMRSFITSPSRLPRMSSTTWPHQSRLLPYSHLSSGSNSSGVINDAFEQVITLGWPLLRQAQVIRIEEVVAEAGGVQQQHAGGDIAL